MPYNTKGLKETIFDKPVPQVFNPNADDYEVLYGDHNAARHVIYGSDGSPITTTGSKLAVRAMETEALIGALDNAPVSDPEAVSATLLALLRGVIKQLQGDGTEGKAAPVSVVGSLANNQTDASVTANTDILTEDYTATSYNKSVLQVMTDTAGVLSLIVDDVSGTLNSGSALTANAWYEFEVSLLSGSTYNLQLSVNATMQVKWQVI
jgi:hypothetical protein